MKQISILHLLFFTFISFCNIYATDYYISPTRGNDGNNGLSSSSPFRSLSRIDNINLQPGDTVYFMEGTYQRPGQTLLTINESGTEDNYITFTNFEDSTPILEFDSWTGIDVIGGSSYIKFDGLHIKGAREKVNLEDAINQPAGCAANFQGNAQGLYNGTGILVVGPNLTWSNSATSSVPHHITVENCEIYDCTSSGVAFQQADYITVINNKVYNNCWYTTYGTSGINFYQFVNTDETTGFHNTVSNNLMYGNQLLVEQIAGGCAFHDGNGFIVDDFNHTQTTNYKDVNAAYDAYTAKTLISNNVSVENGGSGLHFFLSSNCYIYNNTVANNTFQNEGDNSNGELRIGRSSNFEVKNNIFKSEYTVHSYSANSNIDYSNNYQFGPGINTSLANCEDCISENEITFLNTDVNDATPYITDFTDIYTDAGVVIENVNDDYLGNARPFGESFDIGAYELTDCTPQTWYADIDNDGYGDANDTISACEQPEGYVANSTDLCTNDSLKGEPGECGCGEVEGTCEECETSVWYADIDNDGYGDSNDSVEACDQPEGYVANSSDLCVNDGLKSEPGECGCGEVEGTCDDNNNTGEICDAPEYSSTQIYAEEGTVVIYNGIAYQNNWYTLGQLPSSGGPWESIGFCDETGTDCSSIAAWSATTTYASSGNQVVYENNIYENQWHISGGVPGINAAWQLVGLCSSATSNRAAVTFNASVFDINGLLITSSTTTSNNLSEINTNNLESGIYIINFVNQVSGEMTTEKISF